MNSILPETWFLFGMSWLREEDILKFRLVTRQNTSSGSKVLDLKLNFTVDLLGDKCKCKVEIALKKQQQ